MSPHSKNPPGAKVQGYVPQFHKFVLASLIGIEGTNESDVLARIIGYWIRDNESWLAGRGITHQQWRSESGDSEAKEGKLYQYAGNPESRTK